MTKRITIKDIAKKLGLVHSTVSKALQNDPLINIETRKLVSKTAKEMNYHPHYSARSLKTGKTDTIGFVLPEFGSFFAMEILKGAEQEKLKTKYSLHAFTGSDIFPGGSVEQAKTYNIFERTINEGKVDGVIYSSPLTKYIKKIQGLKTTTPVALIEADIDNFHCINFDNELSGFMSTEYLIKRGMKKIAFVVGPDELLQSASERLKGYKKALKKYGIRFSNNDVYKIYLHYYSDGKEVIKKIVKSGIHYDAINCAAGDVVAFGIYNEASNYNIDIPGDVLLMGHDNHEIAELINLTTIEQPMREMGRKAFELVINTIENKLSRPESITKIPKIIKRKTA